MCVRLQQYRLTGTVILHHPYHVQVSAGLFEEKMYAVLRQVIDHKRCCGKIGMQRCRRGVFEDRTIRFLCLQDGKVPDLATSTEVEGRKMGTVSEVMHCISE